MNRSGIRPIHWLSLAAPVYVVQLCSHGQHERLSQPQSPPSVLIRIHTLEDGDTLPDSHLPAPAAIPRTQEAGTPTS